MNFLNKIAILIWPPYGPVYANRQIGQSRMGSDEERWSYLLEKAESIFRQDSSERAKLAQQIHDSESKRKETIESKAATIIQSSSIATSILATIPTLSGAQWNLTNSWKIVAVIFYLLGIIYLLSAIFYAFRVRKIDAVALPCADDLLNPENINPENLQAKLNLIRAKWNEDLLTTKSNTLTAAERLLFRGIATVCFSTITAVTIHLINST